jgi:alcohol dehydrogenase
VSGAAGGAGAVRAAVLEAPRRLVVRDLPRPATGPDTGLVRVEACGLCGTDHEQFTGELFGGRPFIPGHEAVGIVEEIGAVAARRLGVAEGDRVAVEVFQSCRDCPACRSGDARRCERHGLADMYGFRPLDDPPGLWGGYATHLVLGPDACVLRVPGGLDPATATLFNPLGAGLRWAVRVPEAVGARLEGAVVAVLGPGVRGLAALVAARRAGAGFVAVTGVGPRDAPRLALATRLGADLVIDVAATDPVRALRDATGGDADVVVDVTAKAPDALAQAVALARPGGTVVLAGTRGRDAAPGFHPDHVVYKELRIVGALGVDVTDYEEALAMLAEGRTGYETIPHTTARLDEAAGLLARMAGEPAAADGRGTGVDADVPIHGVIVP